MSHHPDLYGVIVEFPGQDPILMESEGPHTTLEAARDRACKMSRAGRYAIVKITFEGGNELLLHDMARLQRHDDNQF